MSGLTGTGALLRFALRRDRVRIAVWIGSLASLYLYCVFALAQVFGDTESQQARAALMRSPASVLMTGPGYGLDHYTLGPIMANELLLWFILAAGLMSAFQIVRHTRAEEESGRSELLRAGVVGRHAPAVAAALTVLIANAILAVTSFAALVSGGLPVADSLAYVLAVALGALVFGAVALVLAQASEHARTASGVTVAVLMAALFIRGVGDMEQVGGSALSWFSPIAWSQQTRVYVDLRWWPLALPVVFIALLLALAALLASRRDYAAGLINPKPGRIDARASLRSPSALAWRQQRTTTIWWAVGFAVMFVAVGTYIDSIDSVMSDVIANTPVVADVFNPDDLTGAFVRIMLLFGAVAAAAFGISAIGRARAEEVAGRTELLLATPISRARWLGAQLAVPTLAAAGLMLLAGLTFFAGSLTVGVTNPGLVEYVAASVAYLPAIAVIVALAAALYALLPRLLPTAWVFIALGLVEGMFGDALNLPAALRWLSPLHWVPNPIATDGGSWLPLLPLTALALALFAAAFVGFHRRDVPTS
ncbi:MAG: hypothetical protein FWD83_00880 [Promicromonosporaceae bacterium]|nr:hypothetical protein [Promicromonosporaceae bacterium]